MIEIRFKLMVIYEEAKTQIWIYSFLIIKIKYFPYYLLFKSLEM